MGVSFVTFIQFMSFKDTVTDLANTDFLFSFWHHSGDMSMLKIIQNTSIIMTKKFEISPSKVTDRIEEKILQFFYTCK